MSEATVRPTPNAKGPLPGGVWLIPVADSAEILPISLRTLRTLIADKGIAHRRVNGRVFLVWPDDFNQFIADSIVV